MQLRILPAMTLATIMLISAVGAVSVTTDSTPEIVNRGESFDIVSDFTFTCADEGLDATEYTATIVNQDEFAFINATEAAVTYTPSQACITGMGDITVEDVTLNVTVGLLAPAFTEIELQPGLSEADENDGGSFTFEVAYDPAFTAPTALGFDAVAGGATATIPLTAASNAASVYTFEVIDVTEGFNAHIQDSLEIDSPVEGENTGSLASSVELHFADHEDHEAGDSHDDMAHDDMEAEGEETHNHWETAEVVLHITMAAQDDLNQTSEPHEVVLTFTNTDPETMPHEHEEVDEDEGFSLPGYEFIAAIAALGAVAAMRRRN